MQKLNFYDNKQKLVRTANSDDYLVYVLKSNRSHFGTDTEYMITLEYLVKELAFNKRVISFVEIVDGSNSFVVRHFIRHFMLSPLTSIEPRIACQLLRQQQISTMPTLNWRLIMSDSFFSRKKKPLSDYVK